LFGYIQTSAEEAEEIMVGEEVSIFTVSKRKRVGEAAGESRAVLHKHAYLHIDQSIHDMT